MSGVSKACPEKGKTRAVAFSDSLQPRYRYNGKTGSVLTNSAWESHSGSKPDPNGVEHQTVRQVPAGQLGEVADLSFEHLDLGQLLTGGTGPVTAIDLGLRDPLAQRLRSHSEFWPDGLDRGHSEA